MITLMFLLLALVPDRPLYQPEMPAPPMPKLGYGTEILIDDGYWPQSDPKIYPWVSVPRIVVVVAKWKESDTYVCVNKGDLPPFGTYHNIGIGGPRFIEIKKLVVDLPGDELYEITGLYQIKARPTHNEKK